MNSLDMILIKLKEQLHNGKVTDDWSEEERVAVVNILDLMYRIGKELVTDKVYDELVDKWKVESIIRSDLWDFQGIFKKQEILQILNFWGVEMEDIKITYNKVQLPYFLGSLEKKKSQKQLDLWRSNLPEKDKERILVSEKLDGVSILLQVNLQRKKVKLFTRGDGEKGKDVSFLFNIVNIFNQDIDSLLRVMKERKIVVTNIRGELAIKKHKDLKQKERQLVAGLTNQKEIDFEFYQKYEVCFVPYRIFELNNILQEYQLLQLMGFKYIPQHELVAVNMLSEELLTQLAIQMKKNSLFQVDGLVMSSIQKREEQKAFKLQAEGHETRVLRIEWQVSKNGKLVPVVYVEPIWIDGIQITKVTGNNARMILQKKIIPGSIVMICRSNDVIPQILSVENEKEPSHDEVVAKSFPTKNYVFDGVNLMISGNSEDNESLEQLSKKIFFFFQTLQVDRFACKTILLILENNPQIKSITDFIKQVQNGTINLKIKGIGEKKQQQLLENVYEIQQRPYLKILVGLNLVSGIGEKILEAVFQRYAFREMVDRLLNKEDITQLLQYIPGIGHQKIALLNEFFQSLLCNIKEYIQVFAPIKKQLANQEQKQKSKDVPSLKIMFSGFRDKVLKAEIESKGIYLLFSDQLRKQYPDAKDVECQVVETMNKKIDFLVVKEPEGKKYQFAVDHEIPIILLRQLAR